MELLRNTYISSYSTWLALEMFTECVKPCKSSQNEYSRIMCQNLLSVRTVF